MKLKDSIVLNTRYTRSTNIERDRDSEELIDAYIPTSRGIDLLSQVLDGFAERDQPRAWSLVGPYGSGKSSFALFLDQLLAEVDSLARKAALRNLRNDNKSIAEAFACQGAWCRVSLTGSSEALAPRLVEALADAAQAYWSDKRGRKPKILKRLTAARSKDPSTSEILSLIDDLQDALEQSAEPTGLLIVVDELGKFLEYEARHYGANDIYLLQGLAERAYTGRRSNLLLFVLLHQGFDLYARGLGESLKNDWAKVQGRFQSVPFVETVEQTLRIVESVFSNTLKPEDRARVTKKTRTITNALSNAGALPGLIKEDEATRLFAACYPLHPIALLTLPVLCRKFAQNERTLFSYLGSRELHGFGYSLDLLEKVGDWVNPSEIYDYFVQNQPAVLADALTHRRWAEVVTAVERSEGLSSEAVVLAKSVGLLNLVSGREGLSATSTILRCVLPTKRQFDLALEELKHHSILQYRKFSREYRVWQGTDFDLDEASQIEEEKLGKFDLAAALTDRFSMMPVVARRHSVEFGALRYFTFAFTDARSYRSLELKEDVPNLVFCLAEGKEDMELLREFAKSVKSGASVLVLYENGNDIRAAINEVLALEKVQLGAQELASDPIASRELKERMNAASITEESVLRTLTGRPTMSHWYWRGKKRIVPTKLGLQRFLSEVMNEIYSRSPTIINELINRDRPSGQANGARNRLYRLMLESAEQKGLGIEKYPPEKSIYRSIFEKGKLHRKKKGEDAWHFVAPSGKDPLSLSGVWEVIEKFFDETEPEPIKLGVLVERLAAPPIGLKRGVFPLIFLHYYIVNRHELAVYDEGVYAPELTYEHLERLGRNPDQFSFQRFRIEGVRISLFSEYSKALFRKDDESEADSSVTNVIQIAKPLSKFMFGLDEYTKKTERLSELTLRVRRTFFLSKSPEKLVFEELPSACGFDAENHEGFADKLYGAVAELSRAHDELIEYMKSAMCESFGEASGVELADLRDRLRAKSLGLEDYTVDVDGLKSFIQRIQDRSGSDDDWFRGMMLFLGQKPSRSWADQDRDTAVYRLTEFARGFWDLRKLQLHYHTNKVDGADVDFILLKSLRRGEAEIDEVVAITDQARNSIRDAHDQIMGIVEGIENEELRLALVAQVSNEYLTAYRNAQRSASDALNPNEMTDSNEVKDVS